MSLPTHPIEQELDPRLARRSRPLLHRRDRADRPAHDSGLKEHFGLTYKDKWPVNGLFPRQIPSNNAPFGYVLVWVRCIDGGFTDGRKHRAMAMCPYCKKIFSAGNINQHAELMHPLGSARRLGGGLR